MTDEPTQEARPPREGRTVPAGAFVIAVMVAMALGVLAVVALTMADGGGDADDTDIRLAAGRFAERFLTFDHDALDDWKADVLELSTSGFAKEVEEVESGLRTLIAESELDASTQVTDIFVGDQERGGVEVVVVYDRDLTGGELARSETDRYVQLAMLRVDGKWLVDNVLDIATSGDLGGGGQLPEVAPDADADPPADPAPTTSERPDPDAEDG
jgi:hypothetical protein